MFYGEIYGKQIEANTLAGLKTKASRIANRLFNSYDKMIVTTDDAGARPATFWRFNRKYPNNTIEYGEWK